MLRSLRYLQILQGKNSWKIPPIDFNRSEISDIVALVRNFWCSCGVHQWLIRFPEFAEFTEFLFHSGKTLQDQKFAALLQLMSSHRNQVFITYYRRFVHCWESKRKLSPSFKNLSFSKLSIPYSHAWLVLVLFTNVCCWSIIGDKVIYGKKSLQQINTTRRVQFLSRWGYSEIVERFCSYIHNGYW